MAKTLIALIIGIFITGLVAGMFTGISLKIGQDVDPEGIALMILDVVCKTLSTSSVASTCSMYYWLITILFLVAGIVEILTAAAAIGDVRIGLAIYALGFVCGILLVMR